MDYFVGGVAALISGNVTPNRPKLVKRALTPTKHQASPNITPKSEFVDDRSIFLSPSLQKKKNIVKKSPKRIFQNPDLDVTDDSEGNSTLMSPKADKVKKHLKEDLEIDQKVVMSPKSPKSPKKSKGKRDKSIVDGNLDQNLINNDNNEDLNVSEIRLENENTPKKKKKQRNSISMPVEDEKENLTEQHDEIDVSSASKKSPKKKRKSQTNSEDNNQGTEPVAKDDDDDESAPKKKKKYVDSEETENTQKNVIENQKEVVMKQSNKKKKKRNKNKKGKNKQNLQNEKTTNPTDGQNIAAETNDKKINKNKTKNIVNPNAITNKDSDSEHESDDEIQSENEQINNEILDTGPAESSDDEAEEEVKKPQKQEKKERKQDNSEEEEAKRTLFVGNVPFSDKCKKEIKKIFSKYGDIETVRIRTVPVKDARMTPKLAVIKNELHPERTTVNVYVRFTDMSSVSAALAENNTVLNDCHLRVSRSDTTGKEYDPRKAIFVGNLPFAIEDDALRAKFENCGEIESIRVVRDSTTKAGKGFGYVNFASKDGVELALALSEEDLTIKNRILRVKRCTLTNNKHKGKKEGNPKYQGNRNQGGRSQGMNKRNQEATGRNQGGFNRNQGGSGRNQGGFGRNQGDFNRNQGSSGRNQGFGRNQGDFNRNQGGFNRNQGGSGRNQEGFGRNQGGFNKNQGKFEREQNVDRSQGQDGAHRRILKKRQNEEGGSGPPNTNQPREKKQRKEFVGVTAEKKKKRKLDKGQKKKKAISEILTKYNEK